MFDPSDPFPLLPLDAFSLTEAQQHAELVDAWIGLQAEPIERALAERQGKSLRMPGRASMLGGTVEDWTGLPLQVMMTPYLEIRAILHELGHQLALPGGAHVIDLGAAYGRMAWVIGRHYPDARFTGYELIEDRVREGNRCLSKSAYPNVRLIQADLSAQDFVLPRAEIYFMYDFGSRSAIEKVLQDLRAIARHQPVTLIGRGRSSRDAIEKSHPWLSEIVRPRHFPQFSIYRSA